MWARSLTPRRRHSACCCGLGSVQVSTGATDTSASSPPFSHFPLSFHSLLLPLSSVFLSPRFSISSFYFTLPFPLTPFPSLSFPSLSFLLSCFLFSSIPFFSFPLPFSSSLSLCFSTVSLLLLQSFILCFSLLVLTIVFIFLPVLLHLLFPSFPPIFPLCSPSFPSHFISSSFHSSVRSFIQISYFTTSLPPLHPSLSPLLPSLWSGSWRQSSPGCWLCKSLAC